jgi:uncharacterized membrane protein YdjX (TVP38/TMEM64 family)
LFLIPGTPKDFLCYILGLGHLTTLQFLLIGGIGRLFGTILLTVGGDLIRNSEYNEFFILAGVTVAVLLVAMMFKKQIEKLLRRLNIYSYKKNKAENCRKKKELQSNIGRKRQ